MGDTLDTADDDVIPPVTDGDTPEVDTDEDTGVDTDVDTDADVDTEDGTPDIPTDGTTDEDNTTDTEDNPTEGNPDEDNPDEDTPDEDNPDEDTPDGDEPTEDTEEEQPLVNLILEDGSGKVDSNTYVTLEYADAYHKSFGRTSWEELDDDSRRSRLVIATRYIDSTYPWKGTRMYRDQRLAFPRVELYDLDGFPVEGIPENLKMAVCEAAFIAISGNSLFLTREANGQVKRESVENAVEIEYFQRESSDEFVSIYSVLDSLLKGLFRTATTRQRINTRVRWID